MMNERLLLIHHSSLITHHASNLPVDLQSPACRLPPVEKARPAEAAFAEVGAEVGFVEQALDGARQGFHVKGVYEQAGVADHLRQARAVASDDRGAAIHRF